MFSRGCLSSLSSPLDTPLNKVYKKKLISYFDQGLKEVDFPLDFVASEGLIQLLQQEDAEMKTLPVLPKLITPIKGALV